MFEHENAATTIDKRAEDRLRRVRSPDHGGILFCLRFECPCADDEDIDSVIDYICKVAHHHEVYYLWRPFLKDPADDMVLELAVTAGCDCIVSYNKRDFEGIEEFGIEVLTAREFLEMIGELK